MGDTLLTNLCTICHVEPPKYRCPRCATRTCSLPCIKKHKSWSDCTGIRDATAYVPKKRLATAAGIDHDYNFISAIERSMERSERDLVEERGILGEEELRPVTVENVEHRFRGGKVRKVLVTKALRGGKGDDEWDAMRGRLARFDITLVRAPVGMSRRKENQTKYFKRTKRIEWFVEWFLVEGVRECTGADARSETITTRVATQLVDDVPIYEAFLRNRKTRAFGIEKEEITDGAERTHDRVIPSGPNTFQDPETSAWIPGTTLCTQNPRTGQWHDRTQQQHENRHPVPLEGLESLRGRARFFLSRPATTSSAPTTLAPIDPGDKLHDVLAGTAVLEYPTLYVLEQGAGLPPGFVVGSKPRGLKRRAGGGLGPGGSGGGEGRNPKARRLVQELEEGEVETEAPAEMKTKGKGVVDYSDSEDESESSDSDSDSDGGDDSDGDEEVLGEVSLSEEDGEDDQGSDLDPDEEE